MLKINILSPPLAEKFEAQKFGLGQISVVPLH